MLETGGDPVKTESEGVRNDTPAVDVVKESPPSLPDRTAPTAAPTMPVYPAGAARFFTITNVKVLALLVVLISAGCHLVVHLSKDSDSCQRMLSDGSVRGKNQWQPYGCMLHNYSRADAWRCVRSPPRSDAVTRVMFLGDSKVREVYYEFVNMLGDVPVDIDKKHSDLKFEDNKINVEFLWHPVVNSSVLKIFQSWADETSGRQPDLVVTGNAGWSIKLTNASRTAFRDYCANLTALVPIINNLPRTKVLWRLQDELYESKLSETRWMLTNKEMDVYNMAAVSLLKSSKARVWSSAQQLSRAFIQESVDGLHASPRALRWNAQMLYNLYCNERVSFDDASCCKPMPRLAVKQIVTAAVFVISFLMTVALHVRKHFLMTATGGRRPSTQRAHSLVEDTSADSLLVKIDQSGSSEPPVGVVHKPTLNYDWLLELTTLLTRLGFIMLYFYLCDRTPLFMKERKQFSPLSFFLPFVSIVILGVYFSKNTKQPTVLNRDQTDEWKGWMQLVILLYHMTGASKVLPIYMQIRVLVSAYIFLSGFGHLSYFVNRSDFSIHRYCTVMVRCNFLVVMLCLVMNKVYMSYYFVPLISFWFTVTHLTLAVFPRMPPLSSPNMNSMHYVYIGVKFVILFVVVTALYQYSWLFDSIFLTRPLKYFFVLADYTVTEWSFRWALDRYSTAYGMAFALGLLVVKKYKLFDDTKADDLVSKRFTLLVNVVSFSAFLIYTIFTSVCSSKNDCNRVHSVLVFVPILAFLGMRNASGWIRAKYSAFFAWFGLISLELFIAQYHVWLAADTHGVLVFVPNCPAVNVILTSFVFVCLSHEISAITSALFPYIVPTDPKNIRRNILCLVLVLLGILLAGGAF